MRATLAATFLLIAACAAAQLPTEHERICALETLHGIGYAECLAAPPPGPVCGNNVIETGETCDGPLLAGETCVSQGFDGGVLACAGDCMSFDTSVCVNDPPAGDIYALLATHLPAAGQFAQIPNTAITAPVLVKDGDFPFCADIMCNQSYNAFMSWGGMTLDEPRGLWALTAGGGRSNYGGNEIYEFMFESLTWRRRSDPHPLTGAMMIDGTSCPRPSDGPPAQHTYNGSLYIPSKDEYFVMGTASFCKAGTPNVYEFWVWSNPNSSWRQVVNPGYNTAPRAAYDAGRDRVYLLGGGTPGGGTYFWELDPQNEYTIVQGPTALSGGGLGDSFFDNSTRTLYYTTRGWGTYALDVPFNGAIAQEALINQIFGADPFHHAWAFHTPSGDLVNWEGNLTVWRYDPQLDIVTDVTPLTGPHPTIQSTSITDKWEYIPEVDAFVGIYDPRQDMWIYRLP